jgi:hypothetical protein
MKLDNENGCTGKASVFRQEPYKFNRRNRAGSFRVTGEIAPASTRTEDLPSDKNRTMRGELARDPP